MKGSFTMNHLNNPLASFSETINKKANSGEAVELTIELYDNGDGIPNGVYTNILINAICYGTHSTVLNITGCDLDCLINVCNSLKEKLENFKREKTL